MHKVVFILPLSDYMLQLTFEDGMEKVVDLRPYIGRGISAALEDINYFRQVQIESGGVLPGRMATIFALTSYMKKSRPLSCYQHEIQNSCRFCPLICRLFVTVPKFGQFFGKLA
ncbi:MAG: DUF2442 domain-containing protein [Anaerolineae bacterium]|nr:DUF2442 domain-containing protein [Anaerolineae bacterium]